MIKSRLSVIAFIVGLSAVLINLIYPIFLAAAQKIYYEPTIKNIINADCSRCHSGTLRNLMDYDSLKAYADTGLLSAMVQGPMRRFAGNDADTILGWVNNGSQEKSPGAPVGFKGKLTYNNSIKYILDKDCLRCHSGQFRNLTTYQNVKVYVDNGLLKTLVVRGGCMNRFAGPDSQSIIAWIDNGSPN